MEALKDYILKHIDFEAREKYGDFESQLNKFLDNQFIYYSACKEFFNLSPIDCMKLATMNGETIDTSDNLQAVTDYARNGATNLVYCCMYSQLLDLYNKAQKRGRK